MPSLTESTRESIDSALQQTAETFELTQDAIADPSERLVLSAAIMLVVGCRADICGLEDIDTVESKLRTLRAALGKMDLSMVVSGSEDGRTVH